MRNGLETENLVDVFERFKQLTFKEMDGAMKRALRKSAQAIRKQTIANTKAGILTRNNHPGGEYEQGNIWDAVRVSKLIDKYDEVQSIKVHVMGNGQPHSKTFRYRFLEKGTKDRYAKTIKGKQLAKPRYLGRITPRRYFRAANSSVNIEPIYMNEINKAVEKVNL